MSLKPRAQLPFPIGEFRGRGEWADRQGGRGEFTSAFKILGEADNAKAQITKREFVNAEGGVLYEEYSVVTFKVTEGHFVGVTIRFDIKELSKFFEAPGVEVTITSGEKKSVGQGYWFNNFLHYDMDVAEDNHLENTYSFSPDKIVLLGSATNKGNFTMWTETLYPVG